MLPATPEADELQQLPLELPRYLLVALRESGGHRAYALLPPYGEEGVLGSCAQESQRELRAKRCSERMPRSMFLASLVGLSAKPLS